MLRIDLAPAGGPLSPSRGREYTYSAAGLTHTGGTNGLHDFCRKLLGAGHAGPATVHGPNGAPRLVIKAIERVAGLDLEEWAEGFIERRHRKAPSTPGSGAKMGGPALVA